MVLSERISANRKLNDSKKNSLRNAILTLALEWKDFDEQLDSTYNCFGECVNELDCREKNLESIRESVEESNRELDFVRKSVESRADELQGKEKEFRSFLKVHTRLLKLKEKQLDERLEEAELREERLNDREERLNDQQKMMEGLLERLEEEKKDFEPIQKSIGERLEEISLKEKYLEGRSKEIDSIQNWIERRAKELDSREERVDERVKELDLMRKLNEERCKELDSIQTWIERRTKERTKELDSREEHVDERVKELDSMRKLNEERCKELKLKEKEVDSAKLLNEERAEKLDSRQKEADSVKNYICQSFIEFHSKNKQLKLDQQLIEERSKELELKEKQIDERSKELELKKKKFGGAESSVKVEQVEGMPIDSVSKCLSADIQFVVKNDGRSLQLFLNQHSNDHESMSSEVYRALRLSLDPAKLVLDAMEGFYPPHLKEGDAVFEEDVVRRSCILLLEQLMKIAPEIHPCVKGKALKLAGEWKEKMGAVASSILEVLGFMQLLASYKLASGFDTDELLKIFMVVAGHKQAPELCRELGFTEKVPDLIDNLVKEDQDPVAVRFIYAFKLVDKFPPVPLLTNFLKRSKWIAMKKLNMEKNPSTAEYRVIDEIVTYVRAVIKCVVDHNLESQLPLKSLERRIEQLLMRKEGNKQIKPARLIKTKGALLYRDNLVMSSTTVPMQSKASASMHDPATHNMAFILAAMDGKNLQLFLNEHLEENRMMHKELYGALQMSSDSGKRVLDAMQENILHLQEKIEQSASKNLQLNSIVPSSCVGPSNSWVGVPACIQFASDPAKLVLDAMQGCYRSNLGIGKRLNVNVAKNFSLLLIQLLRVPLAVKTCVKEGAMKFASDWKDNLKLQSHLEAWPFLLFLATYKVASSFDTSELLDLLEMVYNRKQAIDLFHALGLKDELPYFVSRLIQRGLHLDTMRYIYAFDLIDKFPPASLLKGYLSHVKEVCKNIRREGCNSREAQEMAIRKEVTALNVIINRIAFHGLESQYSPVQLKARVEQLRRQKTGLRSEPEHVKKRFAQVPGHDDSSGTQQLNPAKKLCRKDISTSGGVTNSNHLSSSTCPAPIHQQCIQQQQPLQHPPAIVDAETEPYLRANSGRYSLSGASNPQHGSGIPASGEFPPFTVAAGTPYYSLSFSNQAGLQEFRG